MKKLLFALILIALVLCSFTSCGNMDMWDTVYTYNTAIIELPDGEIVKGKVETWTDYEDGDQIQVKIDGKTYLVHSSDIALIAE